MRGLLPILDAWCEHQKPEGCCNLERFYIFMPYAVADFTAPVWAFSSIPRNNKLHWLKEMLEGIATLHEMGIMHRDIRPANMLIISTEPPQACLCDYGKATQTANSVKTTIGPIYTLAPEVYTTSETGPYTSKIDMWAYGIALGEIFGCSLLKLPVKYDGGFGAKNPRITHSQHSALIKMLDAHCDVATEDKPLVDLISKLLVWDFHDRWSASQALQHGCWKPIASDSAKDVLNKRVQLHDIRTEG